MNTQSYMPVEPGVGMEENFLSLDDILLSHERLPIRIECAFPRLGFLDKSSDTQDIPEVSSVTEKCTKSGADYTLLLYVLSDVRNTHRSSADIPRVSVVREVTLNPYLIFGSFGIN